jgi:hypothetical protein
MKHIHLTSGEGAMKNKPPWFLAAVLLLGILACGQPAPATSEPFASANPPAASPVTVPSKTAAIPPAPTLTAFVMATVTVSPLPPIPEFDELLYFGGGGAGLVCADDQYPGASNRISAYPVYGKGVNLCMNLEGFNLVEQFRLTLTQSSGKQMVLESNGFVLDPNKRLVYWNGYGDRGSIASWAGDGTIHLALRVWWPVTLPGGKWSVTISQPSGFEAAGNFTVERDKNRSYANALDPNSATEILPAGIPGHGIHTNLSGNLEVAGLGYPPEAAIFVLLYRERDFQEGGGYQLVQKRGVTSDRTGTFSAELAGPFEAGQTYLLYGVTDPGTILSSTDAVTCDSLLGSVTGAACDYFDIITPESVPPAPTLADASSCPGAPPQRMTVTQRGFVCTKSDPVLLRSAPNRSANRLTDLRPGTGFLIIGGPSCANNWSWWQVELDSGVIGWIAEGGDAVDPYFICPLP